MQVSSRRFLGYAKAHSPFVGAVRGVHSSKYQSAKWIANNSEVIHQSSYDVIFDWKSLLNEASRDVDHFKGTGKIADYIPELATVDPNQFGAAMVTVDGSVFSVGDSKIPFSIQSVSKVFSLMLAMTYVEDGLWSNVGREPSGNPFNSLIQLEQENGIPAIHSSMQEPLW
jgi:hypothetical protein